MGMNENGDEQAEWHRAEMWREKANVLNTRLIKANAEIARLSKAQEGYERNRRLAERFDAKKRLRHELGHEPSPAEVDVWIAANA